jgi:hypothetical protein
MTIWLYDKEIHENKTFEEIYHFLVNTFVYVGDFLVFATLMYLFYSQGIAAEKLDSLDLSSKDVLRDLMHISMTNENSNQAIIGTSNQRESIVSSLNRHSEESYGENLIKNKDLEK